MSLLLDALKRSEHERQQTLKGRLSHAGPEPGSARARRPWAALIAALLVLNGALVAVWLATSGHEPEAAAAVPPTPAPRHTVRSLAREAALGAPPAEAEPVATAPVAVPVAAATPAPESVQPAAEAPPIDTLPDAVRKTLPALHLDVHVYAANPADRFVIINMEHYREGDVLASGAKVVRITPDGVILSDNGRKFLLSRRH